MDYYPQPSFLKKIVSLLPAMCYRPRRIMAGILLATGVFHQALAADGQSNDTLPLSDTIENGFATTLESVTITGTIPDQPVKSNTNMLKGRLLHLQQSDTLGKTLDKELGVSNASFGPGVGTPVIRGLTGSRIRMA